MWGIQNRVVSLAEQLTPFGFILLQGEPKISGLGVRTENREGFFLSNRIGPFNIPVQAGIAQRYTNRLAVLVIPSLAH